jgi:glucose/arabinose dehydrogenase
VSVGDGGGGCDPHGNAQDLQSRKGKLLSLNPRRIGAGWRKDGYGLRNLWRYSFDTATGRLYAADVGQDQWEEVDTRRASSLAGRPENYMWDAYEGRQPSGCQTGGLRGAGKHVRPIAVYGHGVGCSVTGGYVYRGRKLPRRFRGAYFFGDYCSGRIWRLKFAHGQVVKRRKLVLDTGLNVASFAQNPRGELFVVDHPGKIYRLVRS